MNVSARSLDLSQGETALFGYGSLLSRRSMELTLGRSYQCPVLTAELRGWRRSWDVMMPNRDFYEPATGVDFVPRNIIYLNVRPSFGEAMNGVLFVVRQDELESFDRREWIYDRVRITDDIGDVSVRGGDAYVYVGKPEWRVPPDAGRSQAAVRATYLAIIEEGLTELGADFKVHYLSSTDEVPLDSVFNDVKKAGHPLLAELRSKHPK